MVTAPSRRALPAACGSPRAVAVGCGSRSASESGASPRGAPRPPRSLPPAHPSGGSPRLPTGRGAVCRVPFFPGAVGGVSPSPGRLTGSCSRSPVAAPWSARSPEGALESWRGEGKFGPRGSERARPGSPRTGRLAEVRIRFLLSRALGGPSGLLAPLASESTSGGLRTVVSVLPPALPPFLLFFLLFSPFFCPFSYFCFNFEKLAFHYARGSDISRRRESPSLFPGLGVSFPSLNLFPKCPGSNIGSLSLISDFPILSSFHLLIFCFLRRPRSVRF